MADRKLSVLTKLATTPANDDEVYIRDVSEAPADESKRITIANLLAGAGGASLTIAETEVFSGSSPASSAWTDLDLSGTIGANAALVLLKIASTSRADFIVVRKNGDTDQFYHSSMLGPGVSAVNVVLPNIHYVVLVATDSSGIIEWINEKTNISTITIDIIAYIK